MMYYTIKYIVEVQYKYPEIWIGRYSLVLIEI
nr:MAG TPA: hypothetical protein [Caudoviricetes sp.]